MSFTASDLIFKDYSTDGAIANVDSTVQWELDETTFDRRSQAEMLYFINACYQIWEWPSYSKTPGRKIEKLVRHYVFRDLHTRVEVLQWILANWRHYWHLLPGK